jgi:hypothetical protein
MASPIRNIRSPKNPNMKIEQNTPKQPCKPWMVKNRNISFPEAKPAPTTVPTKVAAIPGTIGNLSILDVTFTKTTIFDGPALD